MEYEHENSLLRTDAPVLVVNETGTFRGDGFRYEVRDRPKVVRYWAMTAVGGELAPEDLDEVTDLGWFEIGVARAKVSYDADRQVIDEWIERHR